MKKIVVTYAVTTAEQSLATPEATFIRAMCKEGHKVRCIKFVRETYGIGLLEAKRVCDALEDMSDIAFERRLAIAY